MRAEMARHPEFEPTWAWDSCPSVRDATAAEYPALDFVEEIFAQPADLFYIATPPATHIPLARQASRAILCEKPLYADRDIAWTRRFFAALDSYHEGVYVNFLGADEDPDRIRDAYTTAVYNRLVDAKTKYDPDNVFHHNQNIRPDSKKHAEHQS
jgi:hypothetical protein